MPTPSQEQRVVRFDLEPPSKRRDGLAELPCTGLGHTEVDETSNVLRIGFERNSRALDRVSLGERTIWWYDANKAAKLEQAK